MKKAIYFAVHDSEYPRNRRIRLFLESEGWDIVVVPAPRTTNMVAGNAKLFVNCILMLRALRGAKLVILAEFSIQYSLMSYLLSRFLIAPHLVDFFIGMEESEIDDRQSSNSRLKRTAYRFLDRLSLRLGDRCLTDTDVRATAQTKVYGLEATPITLPVGAPVWTRNVLGKDRPASHELRLLYYGNYVPLHGLGVLIEAMHIQNCNYPVFLTLVGNGALRAQYEKQVKELGLSKQCVFYDSVPESALSAMIADHDVIVGVFGQSSKAASVIPNKVWQGLASSRVVITRESYAYEEIANIAGTALRQVKPDARSIASEIEALAEHTIVIPENINDDLEKYVTMRYQLLGEFVDVIEGVGP